MGNKRAIINVATGPFYCKMQERLERCFLNSVDNAWVFLPNGGAVVDVRFTKFGCDLLLWRDLFPEGSRPHTESPYGFKIYAMKAAYEKGYTSVLWLDSPAYAVQEDISPIFDRMDKEGYYAMSHIDPLENWVGDEARNYWDVTDENLKGLNLPSGSCYGFSTSHVRGMRLFADMLTYEKAGMFKSRCSYHRHDEAILALLLQGQGLPVFLNDPLFQSDSPECVIKSGGTHDLR